MCTNFCMKFYTTVKQQNAHSITKSVELYLKMTKLRCFNQDNLHFSVFEHRAELAASKCPGFTETLQI